MDGNTPISRSISPAYLMFEGRFKALQSGLEKGDKPLDKQELQKAAQEFESFFLYYLLKRMRDTIPKSGLLGNSRQRETYTAMMDEELAKQMSAGGGIGLARMLVEQLMKNTGQR